jgi:23S rRNA (uracil1939-C5)-methyltransferase
VERKLDYARGEVLEILEPGPGRKQPECSYFSECGGCDLQHLEEQIQLELKVGACLETLRRLGGVRDLPRTRVSVLAGKSWAYRIRTQVHVEGEDRERKWGYFARGSRRLVPVRQCPVLVPELQSVLRTLGKRLPEKSLGRVDLAVGDDGALTASPPVPGIHQGEVSTKVGQFSYSWDARCFFQGHVELLPRLVDAAVGPWEGGTAWDLFSGVGLFSLPLARRYESVVAVESDPVAARYARINARRNRIPNLEVVARDVSGWSPTGQKSPDRVVVDPPRRGLPRALVQLLRENPPGHLTYVSCHPATLARDLKALAPVLHVQGLVLADLFPQTGHMEVVAHLQRA